uniref:Uncharacterized protein n=1 Tax=Romanomermis culicivorax TaxID=13658 RepID=A0A915I006_ROMCU
MIDAAVLSDVQFDFIFVHSAYHFRRQMETAQQRPVGVGVNFAIRFSTGDVQKRLCPTVE